MAILLLQAKNLILRSLKKLKAVLDLNSPKK